MLPGLVTLRQDRLVLAGQVGLTGQISLAGQIGLTRQISLAGQIGLAE
jgi:hypothetical protein